MTTSHQEWLRRVSDYHSGGVTEGERRAVETHLAECLECQEALTMYRRFYTLLSSPLRLGEAGAGFDATTEPMMTISRLDDSRPGQRDPRQRNRRNRRNRALAGIAAALAAAVIIAGFVAVIATRLHTSTASGTPAPTVRATATTQAGSTPTQTPYLTPTPGVAPFVCANPAGSNMVYAYQRADSALYMVTGCGAPRLLDSVTDFPLAWSPSNRYLAVWSGNFSIPDPVKIIDTQTGSIIPSGYAVDFGPIARPGAQVRIFFGWIDDQTFLGGLTTVTANAQGFDQPGETTLERVTAQTGARITVGSINGWINDDALGVLSPRMAGHGRYLYYAGYDSAGTTAYLHRFDLTNRTDTRLVSLGAYRGGGCQATPICGWSAPWDVSSDGAHILYHNPGPTSAPTDTSEVGDTPLIESNPDGTGASQPFEGPMASSLTTPVFAPNGVQALTTGSKYTNQPGFSGPWEMLVLAYNGAKVQVDGSFVAWRSDSAAFVLSGQDGMYLYTIATGATTHLEGGSSNFLWGNGG